MQRVDNFARTFRRIEFARSAYCQGGPAGYPMRESGLKYRSCFIHRQLFRLTFITSHSRRIYESLLCRARSTAKITHRKIDPKTGPYTARERGTSPPSPFSLSRHAAASTNGGCNNCHGITDITAKRCTCTRAVCLRNGRGRSCKTARIGNRCRCRCRRRARSAVNRKKHRERLRATRNTLPRERARKINLDRDLSIVSTRQTILPAVIRLSNAHADRRFYTY